MSLKTAIFNLFKLQKSDPYDIQQFNDNMDIIDEEMSKPPLTVNLQEPDEDRNIILRVVPLAENLESDEAQANVDSFVIRTTGGDTPIESGDAFMSSIRGNMVREGDEPESITYTISPDDGHLSVEIDRDTFVAYVPDSTTINLSYTTDWNIDPTPYGIEITGTPVSGDAITVVYRKENLGTFATATPTMFVSTGWNLYNDAVKYARVVKYSDDEWYMIGGTYSGLKFSTAPSGAEQITVTPDSSGFFRLPQGFNDGYILVTGGNETDTMIWAQWSDWGETPNQGTASEGQYAPYSQTTIDISSVMTSYFPNGLMRVGNTYDEINLNTGYALQRIMKLQNTQANIDYVESLGVPYVLDTGSIYAVSPEVNAQRISVSGTYTAADHGLEYFLGTTVDLGVTALYGQNLKDKLRMDVLTISEQELSDEQKAQVQSNLGLSVANNLTTTEEGYVLDARQGKTLNDDITRLYKKTVTGAPSSSGVLSSGLNVSTYYIVSARISGANGFAFWRGNDAYLVCYNASFQPITTSITVEIIYCKRSELKSL